MRIIIVDDYGDVAILDDKEIIGNTGEIQSLVTPCGGCGHTVININYYGFYEENECLFDYCKRCKDNKE